MILYKNWTIIIIIINFIYPCIFSPPPPPPPPKKKVWAISGPGHLPKDKCYIRTELLLSLISFIPVSVLSPPQKKKVWAISGPGHLPKEKCYIRTELLLSLISFSPVSFLLFPSKVWAISWPGHLPEGPGRDESVAALQEPWDEQDHAGRVRQGPAQDRIQMMLDKGWG